MSQALIALESFQKLSEIMLSTAEKQDWEAFAKYEEDRSTLEKALPSDIGMQLLPTERNIMRRIIERCQTLDKQTYALLKERQDALRVLLRK